MNLTLYSDSRKLFSFFTFLLVLILRSESLASEERLYLRLHDCIAMALENNLDIAIQRLNPQINATAIQQARGQFDPTLYLTPNYGEAKEPFDARSATSFGGLTSSSSRTSSLASGITGAIPTGTRYDLNLNTTDSQSTFNSFEDQYSTNWGLSLTQPLLKNFGIDTQLNAIRIARKNKEISDEVFIAKAIDVVTQIINAYYELFFSIENQKIQFQALELATKLLEDNSKRLEIGIMVPLDVSQAEANVATVEVDLLNASQQVSIRMNGLRSLISREVSELRKQTIWPIDAPTEISIPTIEFEEILIHAMEDRPDYRQAKLAVERQHLQLQYAKNQRYPQVDLVGSYGFNGLGSDLPASVTTDASRWQVGLGIRVPLPDQIGQGQLENSKLQKEQSLLQLKQIEQFVIVELDNAIGDVKNKHKSIYASRTATRTAEQTLDGATARLKAGTLTSFEVVKLQKDLADARSREVRALVDLNIAIAQLHKVEGSSLRRNKVELVK